MPTLSLPGPSLAPVLRNVLGQHTDIPHTFHLAEFMGGVFFSCFFLNVTFKLFCSPNGSLWCSTVPSSSAAFISFFVSSWAGDTRKEGPRVNQKEECASVTYRHHTPADGGVWTQVPMNCFDIGISSASHLADGMVFLFFILRVSGDGGPSVCLWF